MVVNRIGMLATAGDYWEHLNVPASLPGGAPFMETVFVTENLDK